MATVLLLGAGTQSLAIIPAIYKAGNRIVMLTSEHNNYGDRSRYVDKVIRAGVQNDSEYLQTIKDIVSRESVDVVVPMGDDAALFLSRHKGSILGVAFKSPDYNAFLQGYDKNNLTTLCRKKNYPHPESLDLSVLDLEDQEVRDFPFPAMLKPNCTTGGRGMVLVNDYSELLLKYQDLHKEYGEYHLQKFIRPGGRQVKVQLYLNDDKQLLAHSVLQKTRWYPNTAGSSACCVSINDDAIVDICYRILCDIGWKGFADFDTIEDPDTGQLLIMEINPRLPACIKGAVMAGVDWGNILVNDALGMELPLENYRTGVVLRHLGLDMMWFMHARDRFRVKPKWFHFIGQDVHYQDMDGWKDPLPFFAGTFHNISKLLNPSFRKAKTGV